ncbi:MAG: LysR family transcriptional regulator [Chloroflexi bacterium]|nr:LysR family transcriptional regulator [Chloroflexota bacterium]MBV9596815.1 LysR family transcriptional regulator [Chloroflexota bacterium]
MELRQLQYLRNIARASGFRRAADELDMSQATLSEQIKLLEQELGVRLFERGGRNLTLTEAGKTLLARADRILEEVKAAQEEMQEFANLDRGQLIVGTMTGNGPFWLPGFLAAFMRQHPHLELTLVERVSGMLIKMLEAGEVHVACILVPTDQPDVPQDISTRQVYSRELVAVVAPRHRFASRTCVSLDEVAEERLILTSPDEAPRRVVDRAFQSHGLQPQVSFEADDPMTLIGLAAEGIAVGITGESIARRNTERVVAVPIDGVQMRYSMALAWSERGPHTRAMSTFLDFASVWLTEWGARSQAQPLVSAQAII